MRGGCIDLAALPGHLLLQGHLMKDRIMPNFRRTGVAFLLIAIASAGQAQTTETEAQPPVRIESLAPAERPFNPFFETPGSGDLRITTPTGPFVSPERSVNGGNNFDFDRLLAPRTRGVERRSGQSFSTRP